MIPTLRPYDPTDSANWFREAAQHGVPTIVPCFVEGATNTLSCAIAYEPRLQRHQRSSNPTARAVVALDACRRTYGEAVSLGASVVIP